MERALQRTVGGASEHALKHSTMTASLAGLDNGEPGAEHHYSLACARVQFDEARHDQQVLGAEMLTVPDAKVASAAGRFNANIGKLRTLVTSASEHGSGDDFLAGAS